MPVHDFDRPERFIAGTVGPAGQRTFFLQAVDGQRVVSVSLEKQQVQVLADRVNDVLDTFAPAEASEQLAGVLSDDQPLSTPIEDEFRVVALTLGWDPEQHTVIVAAFSEEQDAERLLDTTAQDPHSAADDDVPVTGLSGSAVRVHLAPAYARAFARRCVRVISAGRPPCPLCGGPLEAGGHICPRANGYKR